MPNIVKFVLVLILFFIKDVYLVTVDSACEYRSETDSRTHLPTYIGDCSGMSLTSFPKFWQQVNFLDVAENKIQTLDSKQTQLSSHSLQTLVLSFNEINHISADFFNRATELQEINLSYNNISSLDVNVFQNQGKLVKLDLSFNNFITLPNEIFGPLHNLANLDLSYNNLGQFLTTTKNLNDILKINKDLSSLTLNGLKLTHIDSTYFDEYKKLTTLSLADNAFDNIPTVPYSTEELDLSGNLITFISAKYLNYHSLKVLSLNRMYTLTDIHHYAFYNLYSLEKLFINDCPNLREFNELAFDVASKNYHLHPKVLSLARNGLTTLNESYEYFFRNMYHIDLRHNPWICDCNILWMQEFKAKLYRSHELR